MSSHTAFEKVVKHTLCWLWDQRITKIWKFNILCTDSICSFQIQWVTGKTEAPKGNAIQTILLESSCWDYFGRLFVPWMQWYNLRLYFVVVLCWTTLHVLQGFSNVLLISFTCVEEQKYKKTINISITNCLSYRQNIFQKFLSKNF